MARSLLVLFLPTASALLVGNVATLPKIAPTRAVLPRTPVVQMDGAKFADLRQSLLPADGSDSLRNRFGLQPFIWGLYTLIVPANSMREFLGVATGITGTTLTLVRALAMSHMLLGVSMCKSDSDANAASTALCFFGGWALLLKGALAAKSVGLVANLALYWCSAMALFAVRSVGGLSASSLVFFTTWGTLVVQTALLPLKFAGLTLVPKFAMSGGAKAAAPKPKPAAKPAAASPAATKPAPKPAAPQKPAPPGYKYDAFGTLIIA